MKALLINGSPHQHGCTYTALREAEKALNAEGVETEILWIGSGAVRGCIGCHGCAKNNRRCVFTDDRVNEALDKMTSCDALIVGSPVHYASAGGSMTSFSTWKPLAPRSRAASRYLWSSLVMVV